jgi:5-methylcytosine-specific restriction endonuclease McrA
MTNTEYQRRYRISHKNDETFKEKRRNYYRLYYKNNPEKYKVRSREYRIRMRNNEEYKSRHRMQAHKYASSHRETYKNRASKWYSDNKEKARERQKIWNKNNPEKILAMGRQRSHVRRIQAKCTLKESILIRSYIVRHLSKRTHCCYYCGKRFPGVFHADHIIPLSRGGRHIAENLCISCPNCNLTKSNKTIQIISLTKTQTLLSL